MTRTCWYRFARRTLFAVGAGGAPLIVSLIGATAVTGAMATMALATGSYAITLALDAPRVAGETGGLLGASSMGVAVLGQALLMAAAAALASVSLRRGWRGGRRLSGLPGG